MKPTVVLITGTNRGKYYVLTPDIPKLTMRTGIGKGLTTAYLAMPNTTVIATVRDASIKSTSELSSIPKGPNSHLIIDQLSLDDPTGATHAVSRIQKEYSVDHIDIVIANAGICNHWGPVRDMEDSVLIAHFEVNTLGPLRLFKAAAPLLKASGQPKFVYISTALASIDGLENSPSLTAAYGVSKAAGNYLIKKIHGEDETLIAFSIDPG
jgi:norsolorinic acid ketoreductase